MAIIPIDLIENMWLVSALQNKTAERSVSPFSPFLILWKQRREAD